MIRLIISGCKRIFLIIFLNFKFSSYEKIKINNINFKQIDFINYKLIKQYIFKDSFFKKKSYIDAHSFNFLFYLQKIGGVSGIELSKKNIFLWFSLFKNKYYFPWEDKLTSQRLLNIIYNYDFINSVSTKKDKQLLNKIIITHISRLLFEFNNKNNVDISSNELAAVTLIKCLNKNLNNNFLLKFEKIVESQVDELGMHKSYSLLEQAKYIASLNEIKNILLFYKISIPNKINYIILNMTSLLAQYIHEDGSMALFNGTNNNYIKQIEKIINREEFLKSRSFKNANNGIAFYADKKRRLFFDVVQPNKLSLCKDLSAGTLSIEISALNEKIITNCGASESAGKNPEYLRYSAAHSTIVLNNTNISEIKERTPHLRFPQKVSFIINYLENIVMLEGSHNGYMKKFNKIVKRKITVDKKQDLITGEDAIISLKSNQEKSVYHIRFHLMPGISTTLTTNKKNIILKTKKNIIWVFKSKSELEIEKSIFINNDTTIQTQQIVIKGITLKSKQLEKWSIQKM